MSITTRSSVNVNKVSDGFAQIFRESQENFTENGIDVLGGGIQEVMFESTLFEKYLDGLSEGLDADQSETFRMLAENARTDLLESFGGIAPVHSLALPVLRRFWPRLAMTHVIPTTPVQSPASTMGVMVPYVVGVDGTRYKLPQQLDDITSSGRLALTLTDVTVPSSAIDVFDGSGADTSLNDSVDVDFFLTGVKINMAAVIGTDADDIRTVGATVKMDATTNVITTPIVVDGSVADTLFVTVDRKTATLKVASVEGRVTKASFKGYVSSEFMNRSEEVVFEVERRNIDIGSGEPITASITQQMVQDAAALYNIDAHMQLADTASKYFATRHDVKAMNFVQGVHDTNGEAGNEYTQYSKSFDMHPPAQFSGAPSDWREELKRVIDYTVDSMKSDFHQVGGETRIYGHNLDVSAIHNAQWAFQGSVGDEFGGVKVDYSVGAYQTGNGRASVVSSTNVPVASRGKLKAVFIPDAEDSVTFRYLPYSFTLNDASSGYRNPNKPNVPGFVMNRRDEFFVELPMVAEVVLEHNDGTLTA